jgi:hypothetical protein
VSTKRAPTAKKAAKKPAKKVKYTKVQTAEYRWILAHPTKRTSTTRTPAKKRAAVGSQAIHDRPHGGLWISGGNDELPSCVAAAVANSLLAVTGERVTDNDVLRLWELSGGGDGVSIPDTLSAAFQFGIGGHKPAAWFPVGNPLYANGLLLGMTDGLNDHAVTLTPKGLISWGAPLDAEAAEGWHLDGDYWFIDWRGEGI